MATPLEMTKSREYPPRTVVEVKEVKLMLVSYTDEYGTLRMAPVIVGENNAHLLDARQFGFSTERNEQGPASQWMRDGIFAKLKKGK